MTNRTDPQFDRAALLTVGMTRSVQDFGEALERECPDNDCIIFRNLYRMYTAMVADYKAIFYGEVVMSEPTARAIRAGIRERKRELYEMYDKNLAVARHRAELETRARQTQGGRRRV